MLFPPEGFGFYVRDHRLIPVGVDFVLAALFACVAAGILVLLWRRGARFAWSQVAWSIFGQYLAVCLAFAFLYQGLFQLDSRHFKLNAATFDERVFRSIEENRTTVDKAKWGAAILALTLAGLQKPAGHDWLDQLAAHIDGPLKSAYLVILSLAVVGPPELLSAEEAEFLTRAYGRPSDAAETFRRQQEAAVQWPGLVASLPSWDALQKLPLSDLYSLRELLATALRLDDFPSIRNLEQYISQADGDRLREYMAAKLGAPEPRGGKVDLRVALDAIKVRTLRPATVVYIETAHLQRLIDFAYFSLITITTVGYGDILPNSTLARAAVGIEVLAGVSILVFVVARFLAKQNRTHP